MKRIILPISALFFFLATSPVFASDFAFSIYPPVLKVVIKPGKTISQVFQIQNQSQTDQTLITRIIPFTKSDGQGNPELDITAKPDWLEYFSLANANIKLNEPFTLAANQSDQLVLTLQVPETAALKDIYATLLISTYRTDQDPKLQGTELQGSVGANLLITFSTTAFPPTILKFDSFSPIDTQYLQIGNLFIVDNLSPIYFQSTVRNLGDFATETRGLLKILKGGKTPTYLQSILPQYLIAKNTRKLISNTEDNLSFHPNISQIGHYTVDIEINSDNAQSNTRINLLLLPIKAILGLAVGTLFILSISKILKKSN